MTKDDMPDLSPEEHAGFNRRASEMEDRLGDTIVHGPNGDRKIISEAGFEKILGMARSYPNVVVVSDRSFLEGSVTPLPPKRENPIELINPLALEKVGEHLPKSIMAAQAESWNADLDKGLRGGFPVGQMPVIISSINISHKSQIVGRLLRDLNFNVFATDADAVTYRGIIRQKQREVDMFSADFDGDMIIGNGIRRVIAGLLRRKTKKGPKRKFKTKYPFATKFQQYKELMLFDDKPWCLVVPDDWDMIASDKFLQQVEGVKK